MLNYCCSCKAVREYPDGRLINTCPRCQSHDILHLDSPASQAERNRAIVDMIKGTYFENCPHNRLTEDGICRSCGRDCRGIEC